MYLPPVTLKHSSLHFGGVAVKKPPKGIIGGDDFRKQVKAIEADLEQRGIKPAPEPPPIPTPADDDTFADELPTTTDEGDVVKPIIVYVPTETPAPPPPPPPLL